MTACAVWPLVQFGHLYNLAICAIRPWQVEVNGLRLHRSSPVRVCLSALSGLPPTGNLVLRTGAILVGAGCILVITGNISAGRSQAAGRTTTGTVILQSWHRLAKVVPNDCGSPEQELHLSTKLLSAHKQKC